MASGVIYIVPQLYVVVSPEGRLETGHHSSAVPKLYLLPWARAVANRNSRSNKADKRIPWRIIPITLAFGTPV